MRDGVSYWTDAWGDRWPVISSVRRLKFKYPAHAALRRHVFHADGFKCRRCPATAIEIPANYNGHNTLHTNTFTGGGFRDVLVLDHIVTLKAGGLNDVGNFQTLCETCNKRKQKEDNATTEAFREASND